MIKKIGVYGILFVFLIAMATGCSAVGRTSASGANPPAKNEALKAAEPAAHQSADSVSSGGSAGGGADDISLAVDPNRKLIRTGELQIESLDFDKSLSSLTCFCRSSADTSRAPASEAPARRARPGSRCAAPP